MKFGEFKTIDELLNELNLIAGTTLSIGDWGFYDCCHFDIKKGINYLSFVEGWITKIDVYYKEDEETCENKIVTDITINLKMHGVGFNYPSMVVNKEWFNKNVDNIHIWSTKE